MFYLNIAEEGVCSWVRSEMHLKNEKISAIQTSAWGDKW